MYHVQNVDLWNGGIFPAPWPPAGMGSTCSMEEVKTGNYCMLYLNKRKNMVAINRETVNMIHFLKID